MSNTHTQSGTRRGRLLDKAVGTTRRSRLTRLASATVLASALVAGPLLVTAAPASAGTGTVVNPNCPVPTSVTFQLTGTGASGNFPDRIKFSFWQATYNGVQYYGEVVKQQGGGGGTIAPNLVTPAIQEADEILSATCAPA